jgi:hypothetical protein
MTYWKSGCIASQLAILREVSHLNFRFGRVRPCAESSLVIQVRRSIARDRDSHPLP